MLSKEEVRHVAKLARIELTEEELEEFGRELSSILEYYERLAQVDVTGVEPMTHTVDVKDAAREDSPRRERPETVNRLMGLAHEVKDGLVKVRSILR